MRLVAAGTTVLRLRRVRPFVPVLEAIPAELVGRADLVGKAECVDPAFLFGSPAAIPGELEPSRLAPTFNDSSPDEVRAPGSRVHVHPFDSELGVRVKQLIDEPDHLDTRDVTRQRDRARFRAGSEGHDVSFEGVRRAGAGQQFEVEWHGRNIQTDGSRAGSRRHPMRTKLTAGSAHAAGSGARQW